MLVFLKRCHLFLFGFLLLLLLLLLRTVARRFVCLLNVWDTFRRVMCHSRKDVVGTHSFFSHQVDGVLGKVKVRIGMIGVLKVKDDFIDPVRVTS